MSNSLTLRGMIHKILKLPDYLSDLPDEPTDIKTRVQLDDGRTIKDIYARGDDVIIIEVNNEL